MTCFTFVVCMVYLAGVLAFSLGLLSTTTGPRGLVRLVRQWISGSGDEGEGGAGRGGSGVNKRRRVGIRHRSSGISVVSEGSGYERVRLDSDEFDHLVGGGGGGGERSGLTSAAGTYGRAAGQSERGRGAASMGPGRSLSSSGSRLVGARGLGSAATEDDSLSSGGDLGGRSGLGGVGDFGGPQAALGTTQPRSYALSTHLSRFFYKLGYACASNPSLTFATALALLALANLGWMHFAVETDPVHLWVAKDSESKLRKEYFDEQFRPFYRTQQVFLMDASGQELAGQRPRTSNILPSLVQEGRGGDNITAYLNEAQPALNWDRLQLWAEVEAAIRDIRTERNGLTFQDTAHLLLLRPHVSSSDPRTSSSSDPRASSSGRAPLPRPAPLLLPAALLLLRPRISRPRSFSVSRSRSSSGRAPSPSSGRAPPPAARLLPAAQLFLRLCSSSSRPAHLLLLRPRLSSSRPAHLIPAALLLLRPRISRPRSFSVSRSRSSSGRASPPGRATLPPAVLLFLPARASPPGRTPPPPAARLLPARAPPPPGPRISSSRRGRAAECAGGRAAAHPLAAARPLTAAAFSVARPDPSVLSSPRMSSYGPEERVEENTTNRQEVYGRDHAETQARHCGSQADRLTARQEQLYEAYLDPHWDPTHHFTVQGVKGSFYNEETGEPELIADWADTAVPVRYFSNQALAKKDFTAGQAAAAAASLRSAAAQAAAASSSQGVQRKRSLHGQINRECRRAV
ncbi:niemann-Pick type C- protein 1, partial [Tilletia horrida]